MVKPNQNATPIAYRDPADFLTGPLEDYLRLRRSIGFRYETPAGYLSLFVRFLRKRGVDAYDQVDHSTVNLWVMTRRAELAPSTFNGHVSAVALFFDYLIDIEAVCFNPFNVVMPVRVPKHIPFVFSIDQLFFFFDAIHRANKSQAVAREQGYYTIFHTIYALGLRISELCNLDLEDVDFNKGVVHIRRTKFFKSRLLPINLRTRDLLSEYLETRRKRPAASKELEGMFFLDRFGKKLAPGVLLDVFGRYVGRANIQEEKRSHPNMTFGAPRLHSLRHTFAVHRLLKWYRDGVEDINSKLPLLATYMGHTNFTHTQVYLNITEEISKLAAQKFAKKYDTFDNNPKGKR